MRTPEGIGFGSSRAEVRAAYPDADVPDRGSVVTVPASGSDAAVYSMMIGTGDSGTVYRLELQLGQQDCEI